MGKQLSSGGSSWREGHRGREHGGLAEERTEANEGGQGTKKSLSPQLTQ